jgi:hypothetical protein
MARKVLKDRLAASSIVDTLSTRGGKSVNLLKEPDGREFVERRYEKSWRPSAVFVSGTFPEMLQDFIELADQANITVVPHSLQEGEGYIVYADKINGIDVSEASIETKIALTEKLVRISFPDRRTRYRVNISVLCPDMFIVQREQDGREVPVLTDIDPELSRNMTVDGNDAFYINCLAGLFYDHWCKDDTDDEKREVMTALCKSLMTVIGEDSGMSSVMALSNVNHMKNGIDPR